MLPTEAGHYQKRRSDDNLFHGRFYFMNREEPERLKKMFGFIVTPVIDSLRLRSPELK